MLSRKRLFGLLTTEQSTVVATDYTDYALVHHCGPDHNMGTLLDGAQDQVQVFTRSGQLAAPTASAIATILTTQMPLFDQTRLNAITTTGCTELGYWSQIRLMLNQPDVFFQ